MSVRKRKKVPVGSYINKRYLTLRILRGECSRRFEELHQGNIGLAIAEGEREPSRVDTLMEIINNAYLDSITILEPATI